MTGKTFVDTNILIYAHDLDAKEKQLVAQAALTELWKRKTGCLSGQVLQEFYVNVTKKVSRPLARKSARSIVERYSLWCMPTTTTEIALAFRIEDEARIGFWDALICAAALKSGAEAILSEDLNPGQRILGVRIVNPFAHLKAD
jgi:predicted nucleic acid-binding protein